MLDLVCPPPPLERRVERVVTSGFTALPLTDVSLINLASILIVYDYCVPVQMVMQMAMGAVQVCVSV